MTASLLAQTRKPVPARRKPPPPPLPALQTEAADVDCPTPLGVGVATKEIYCDVLTGRDPAVGVIIKLPPHSGPVTLTFDLHNRHTYFEEEARQRGYPATSCGDPGGGPRKPGKRVDARVPNSGARQSLDAGGHAADARTAGRQPVVSHPRDVARDRTA